MSFLFKNLDVYNKALHFVSNVTKLCQTFPKGNYFLIEQLKRAALSIVLNIAEGSGRWHKKEKRTFYLISRGSAFECVAVFDVLRNEKIIDDNVYSDVVQELEEISKILSTLVRKLEIRY